MICSRCDTDLEAQQFRGIEVDVCPECAGTWFDAGELESYRASHEDHVRTRFASEDSVSSRCPRCITPTLVTGAVEGKSVDRCSTCRGVFLSKAQLRAFAPTKNSSGGASTIDALGSGLEVVVEGALDLLSGLFDGL